MLLLSATSSIPSVHAQVVVRLRLRNPASSHNVVQPPKAALLLEEASVE